MSGRFWLHKSLLQFTGQEWESLCDGCGRCCLHKIEDENSGELLFTQVSCRLLDIESCRCTDYPERQRQVPDCLDLRKGFTAFHWLPATCAYRLIFDGKALPEWHPLVSGRAESVHDAGVSVRDYAIPETEVDDIEDYVIEDFD
jgi:uncharacterized cysteine cluster protein YcgN (CxxCxxCC family)